MAKSQPGRGPDEYRRACEKSSSGGGSVGVDVMVGVRVMVGVLVDVLVGVCVGVRVGLGGVAVGEEVTVAVGLAKGRLEHPAMSANATIANKRTKRTRCFFRIMGFSSPELIESLERSPALSYSIIIGGPIVEDQL